MNKLLVNICCCFIPKKNRHHFRETYLKRSLFEIFFLSKDLLGKICKIENNIDKIENNIVKLYNEICEPKKQVYDFVISLGIDCYSEKILRDCNLANESIPLDHTHNFGEIDTEYKKSGFQGFESKMNLIINNFDNFINLEDLYVARYSVSRPYENTTQSPTNYVCGNKRTGLYYYHNFNCNNREDANTYILTKDIINDMYDEVKTKFDRRIKRFNENLHYANKVLLVYIDIPSRLRIAGNIGKYLDEEIILKKQEELQNKFPNKQIDFLFLEHDENKKNKHIGKIHLNKNILRIRSDHSNLAKFICRTTEDKTNSDDSIVYNILRKFKLNDKLFM
jgi:hypothetical protein